MASLTVPSRESSPSTIVTREETLTLGVTPCTPVRLICSQVACAFSSMAFLSTERLPTSVLKAGEAPLPMFSFVAKMLMDAHACTVRLTSNLS